MLALRQRCEALEAEQRRAADVGRRDREAAAAAAALLSERVYELSEQLDRAREEAQRLADEVEAADVECARLESELEQRPTPDAAAKEAERVLVLEAQADAAAVEMERLASELEEMAEERFRLLRDLETSEAERARLAVELSLAAEAARAERAAALEGLREELLSTMSVASRSASEEGARPEEGVRPAGEGDAQVQLRDLSAALAAADVARRQMARDHEEVKGRLLEEKRLVESYEERLRQAVRAHEEEKQRVVAGFEEGLRQLVQSHEEEKRRLVGSWAELLDNAQILLSARCDIFEAAAGREVRTRAALMAAYEGVLREAACEVGRLSVAQAVEEERAAIEVTALRKALAEAGERAAEARREIEEVRRAHVDEERAARGHERLAAGKLRDMAAREADLALELSQVRDEGLEGEA